MARAVIGIRELRRRQAALGHRIGRDIRDLRREANVTQSRVATAAGIDNAHLSRIERGLVHPSIDVLIAIGASLGSDLGVRFFPGTGPRLHDRFQAPMIDALIRSLDPRWIAEPEVPVLQAHGVIDLVLRDREHASVIACECHSELRRLELAIRRLAEKTTALGPLQGTEREVSSLLLLRSTSATRQIARLYEATLAAAFPAKTRDAFGALTGKTPWPGPAIVWAHVEGARAEILDGPPRRVRLGR